MPIFIPRRSVRILSVLSIFGLFAAFLRSAVYSPRGEPKTSSTGYGHGLPRITVTRMRTAWAETTRTVIAGSEPTAQAHAREQHPLTDSDLPLQQHHYRSDGLLEVNPNGPHPIFELIRNAEAEWEGKIARSSKTLAQAVAEYERRYKRSPPLGFDDWSV